MMVVASSSASRMYAVAQLQEEEEEESRLSADTPITSGWALTPHEQRIRRGRYRDLQCFML